MIFHLIKKTLFGPSTFAKPVNFKEAINYAKKIKVSCYIELNNENLVQITLTGGDFLNNKQTFTNGEKVSLNQVFEIYKSIKKVNNAVFLRPVSLQKKYDEQN